MEAARVVKNGILVFLGLYFHSTVTVFVQFLSFFIWPVSRKLYSAFNAHVMRQWSQNLFEIMNMFAPGDMIITFDEDFTKSANDEGYQEEHKDEKQLEKILTRNSKGEVTGICFPERLIAISNHQIVADWIYIWFLAYLSKAHGALKIMLKDSLSRVPIFGMVKYFPCGIRHFKFIFLKRNLEQDKDTIFNNLTEAKRRDMPMWLVLFPEGTVISDNTRAKSRDYAAKLKMDDFKFTLFPRTTGLLLCKEILGDSVEYLYDLTIAYPGIPIGKNPEDVMTLKRIFAEGNGPRQIHIHIHRYRLDSLPKGTEEFTDWLVERWSEKDKKLIYFNKHGKLPLTSDLSSGQDELITSNRRTFKIPVKLRHPFLECLGYLSYLVLYIPIMYVSFQAFRYCYTAVTQL